MKKLSKNKLIKNNYSKKSALRFISLNQLFFFLFIFLLPTQFGKYFFLPFSYLSGIRVDYLAIKIYLLDIIVFFLALINLKTVFSFFKNKIFLWLLPLFLLNILFSKLPLISTWWLIKICEFLVVFALGQKVLTVLSKRTILIGFALMTFCQFLLVLWQFLIKSSVNGLFYFFGERMIDLSIPGIAKTSLNGVEYLRPYGTFSHPNSLAGFFLLIYIFVLTYRKFKDHVLLKYFSLFTASLIIFFSFSKTAILVYLLINLIYVLTDKKRICRVCTIPKIIVPIFVSLIFLRFQGDPLTINKRFELIKNSFSIITKHPIIGVGLGNYLIAQSEYFSKFTFFINQPVHNIFLLFLSETGIIIFGLIFYFVIKKLFTKPKTKIKWLVIIAVFLTGLMDHYWLTANQNFLLLAFILFTVFPTRSGLLD